jgi:DMSO/TMAO reductase YedYZ molybdopterin-dependent catalytic subunit
MSSQAKNKLTRRSLLKATVASGAALFADLNGLAWLNAQPSPQTDPFAGGTRLGTVGFINESTVLLDAPQGSELDGRLYTDLSVLEPQNAITSTEKFYIRTRVSELLPDPASWIVTVNGLVVQSLKLRIEDLRKAAKPMGAHVMECAGNVRLARFGLISAGDWTGVPIAEILADAKEKPAATRVRVSGFDRYANESKTSVPGASWIFPLEQLKAARAFLATELNHQQLTKDHGAPLRLVVPGWYGCTCIKWVNEIRLVNEDAEATSQMLEYASRTLQKGVPKLAREYQPAAIEQAAMPIRIEKWSVEGKIKYRVVGIAWGGSQPVKVLGIRFNPEEDYVPVNNFNHVRNDPWTLWTHVWSPQSPGVYMIRLAVKEPAVQARRLDSGYYVRTVEINEV